MKPLKIKTNLEWVHSFKKIKFDHDIDRRIALRMAIKLLGKKRGTESNSEWIYPPILLSRNGKGKLDVIDGHHRIHVARYLGFDLIPAYVFEQKDADRIINRYFDGIWPEYHVKLDKYILLPNGDTYEQADLRK